MNWGMPETGPLVTGLVCPIFVSLRAFCLAAETPERCVPSIGIPAYPALAEQARIEGTVKLGIAVDQTGAVAKATAGRDSRCCSLQLWKRLKPGVSPLRGNPLFSGLRMSFRTEGQEVYAPVGCSRVKLDLPAKIEISSPPIAVQTSSFN